MLTSAKPGGWNQPLYRPKPSFLRLSGSPILQITNTRTVKHAPGHTNEQTKIHPGSDTQRDTHYYNTTNNYNSILKKHTKMINYQTKTKNKHPPLIHSCTPGK